MAKGNRTLPEPALAGGTVLPNVDASTSVTNLALPVAEVIQAVAAAVVPPNVPLPETGGSSARMYALAAAKVCESAPLMPQSRAKAIAYLKAAIAMLEG